MSYTYGLWFYILHSLTTDREIREEVGRELFLDLYNMIKEIVDYQEKSRQIIKEEMKEAESILFSNMHTSAGSNV